MYTTTRVSKDNRITTIEYNFLNWNTYEINRTTETTPKHGLMSKLYSRRMSLTPSDDGRFENEVRSFVADEDLHQHEVHVVRFDAVPEQRDEDEVVAEDVRQTTSNPRSTTLLGDVENDEEGDERHAQVGEDSRRRTLSCFSVGE